jgi:hypothetical protein
MLQPCQHFSEPTSVSRVPLNAIFQASQRVNGFKCRRFADSNTRKVRAALLIVALALFCLQMAAANEERGNLETHKLELEVQKLDLEVSNLKKERPELWWLPGLFGVIAGVASGLITFRAAHRAQLAELDQAVHEKRLEYYLLLVNSTSRLAIYFPEYASVQPDGCEAMGRAMSQWYFDHGGLLLSGPARTAYFRLARALTRAALAKILKVPTFPEDAKDISVEKVREYECQIKQTKPRVADLDPVENWVFGGPAVDGEPNYLKFKDYVFLRNLTSELRTTLTEDLRGRLRPS